MEKMIMHGPVELEMQVVITDGKRFGSATIGLGFGEYPTQQDIAERVKRFAEEELHKMAPGFHMCDKDEFWHYICAEKFGTQFARPGSAEWDCIAASTMEASNGNA